MSEQAVKASNGIAGNFGDGASPPTMREKVNALEQHIMAAPQTDIPVEHFFANAGTKRGVYARQIFIPKGTVLTGKIHKYEQINIISKGDISVLTEDGIKRVQAPFTIVSPAGTKRIAYTHEDTVWTTIHATEETDLEKIEAHYIAQSDAEYLEFCETLRLEGEKKCLG